MTEAPKLLFADAQGRIYDHPYLEMVGSTGRDLTRPAPARLVTLPKLSRLYYHPGCPPYGYDRRKKRYVLLREMKIGRKKVPCSAVSAFIRQGWVRLMLPAMDSAGKNYMLPMWAYSAAGFSNGDYVVPALAIDGNTRWDPDNFDDRQLTPAVRHLLDDYPGNRLVRHLQRCAQHYHCFAAKNFFLRRWEAPIPTSPSCNAGCLGCISFQPGSACTAPQDRIDFVPGQEEIVTPFRDHLEQAPDPIVSFGQGCEGEPILQWQRICGAIRGIRQNTSRGTINLNTNGSLPDHVAAICDSGLDSIRISINSARPELYERYYRPRGYGFEDVLASIATSRARGVFTMINYLVFPGITDQPAELEALQRLVERTEPHLLHFKNLNIDPDFYLQAMQPPPEPTIGIDTVIARLRKAFPQLQFGYFNRTREEFFPEM